MPSRIGSPASGRAIGYLVAAGMIGGAILPGAIGLVMQLVDVTALGACLSALALIQAALHLLSTGRIRALVPARSS
jgi:fucose permease